MKKYKVIIDYEEESERQMMEITVNGRRSPMPLRLRRRIAMNFINEVFEKTPQKQEEYMKQKIKDQEQQLQVKYPIKVIHSKNMGDWYYDPLDTRHHPQRCTF